MQHSKPLVTLPELSRLLGVPAVWLRQEAEAGRLPSVKAGRQFLFSTAAVEQVLIGRASEPLISAPRALEHVEDGADLEGDGA
jgi:excisionase family DNA binding protein